MKSEQNLGKPPWDVRIELYRDLFCILLYGFVGFMMHHHMTYVCVCFLRTSETFGKSDQICPESFC